jgi:eukaryotic-like serine/threonine-protein kinase
MALPSTAQSDTLIGTTINDRFKILGVIAKGGMGKVYRAEQHPLGRIVAVKVLHPNFSGEGDPEFNKRFALEASVVSRLKHPNTITVYEYGETPEGVLYMAMELLEGRTLHRLIRDEGAMEVGRALHILLQIARSLREAHGQGVIHRDLKPANIFLICHDDDADFVKVLDFGLVKNLEENDAESLTKTGLFMGSPKYMAPEQIRGDKVTAATDVYALGVMLFEMLAGKVPYERSNSANMLLAHVNDPIPTFQSINPLVSVPQPIEELVYRCLSKIPEERFQSMDELIVALRQAGVPMMSGGPSLTGEFYNSVSAGRALPSGSFQSDSQFALRTSGSGSSSNAQASTQPPPLPALSPAENRRSPILLVVLGGMVLLLVAFVIYTKMHASVETTSLPPARVEPTVSVVLESDPNGAEVLEHGVVIGHTPLRETWSGVRGNPAEHHTLVFRVAGHADAVVTLTGATLNHIARLERVAPPTVLPAVDSGAPVRPAQPAVNTRRPVVRPLNRARDAGAGVPGYRHDPY